MYHSRVTDETVARVLESVNQGMGFLALHSAHYSKPFQAVVGGPGHLKGGWRENDPPEKEFVSLRAVAPNRQRDRRLHALEREEMYGSPFDVPPPLQVIFQSPSRSTERHFLRGWCGLWGGQDRWIHIRSREGRGRRLRESPRILFPSRPRNDSNLPQPDNSANPRKRNTLVRASDVGAQATVL